LSLLRANTLSQNNKNALATPLTELPVDTYCYFSATAQKGTSANTFLTPAYSRGGRSLKAVICLLSFVIAFTLLFYHSFSLFASIFYYFTDFLVTLCLFIDL